MGKGTSARSTKVAIAGALACLLAGCTEPNPAYQKFQYLDAGNCDPGEKRCAGQITQVCAGAGSYINERKCPDNVPCKDGLCVPAGSRCRSTCNKGGQVCTIFVDPMHSYQLDTFCAAPLGQQPGGMPCTSNGQCQSGFCFKRNEVRTCYEACRWDKDCAGLFQSSCMDLFVTLHGVQGKVSGCVPSS